MMNTLLRRPFFKVLTALNKDLDGLHMLAIFAQMP